jgi:hypothetical protein
MNNNILDKKVFVAKLELIKALLTQFQSKLNIDYNGFCYHVIESKNEGDVIVSEWNWESYTVILRCPLYEIESNLDNILSVLLNPECLKGYSTFREALHNQLYPTFALPQ